MQLVTAYTVAVVVAVSAVVVGGAVAGWLLARYERGTSAFAFGLFMLLMTVWSATHLGTLRSETLQWQLRFTQLSYVGVVFTPVLWLVFVLRYIDRSEWLSRRRVALLSVVPVVTLVLVVTARWHDLFYTAYSMDVVAGHPLLRVEAGPWYLINIVYSYTLLALGTGLLVASALSLNRLYRRQAVALVVLTTFPWFVSGTYLMGVRPMPWVDPTPVAFVATSVPFAVLVVRTDLEVFLPVAHERMFHTLEDPILVVDPTRQVVDANPAAMTVLGDGTQLEGQPIEAVLPDELCDQDLLTPGVDEAVECTIPHDGRQHHYLVRCRVIDPDRNPRAQGSLVSLTDITVQKAQQQALETRTDQLERKNEQLERLADVVSHDLSAPLSTAEKTLSLLRADIDPDPAVEQSLDDLTTVHDRLRDFADHLPRLARESIDVETTTACDLDTVARAAWNTVETDGLELVVTDSRTLHGDRRRLQQVFENLFRNTAMHGSAISHGEAHESNGSTTTGAGASRVRVGTYDAGVFVEDDGLGISPEQQDVIFEYGLSTGDSSGFGLAIVRTIVEAHGWEIELADTGRGARFEISIDD